ncbi:hypothetical protein [Burkholderia metallica]|uniref:hypothetical protein n=1 Tax=Burkholderia metallica TaxID=488729 RepID=UPI001CF1A999|nr:hypothetical protein [Burkholderia metallica]MCA8018071.1 hypothetical protein [Burkholderia metallica]
MSDVLDMLSGRAAISKLQAEISQMPQWDASDSTSHFFADGMYARVLARPADTLIVGKVHRKEHFYIVCCGTVRITQGDGSAREVTGPAVLVSKPGTKRAVYAVTDATCMTVHRTKKRNLDKIERELIEPDGLALYDAHNRPRALK